jgi:hypothetical protein
MGDIWKNGEKNDRNVWRVSKECSDTGTQNMEASMRQKKSTCILQLIEE